MLFRAHIEQQSIKLVIFSEFNLKVWIQILLLQYPKGKANKKHDEKIFYNCSYGFCPLLSIQTIPSV